MWILAMVTCQNRMYSPGILCLINVDNKHISSQGNIKLKVHGWDGVIDDMQDAARYKNAF